MRTLVLATLAVAMATVSAANADPILGNWKTMKGATAQIATCAAGFCITLKDSPFAGKQIGTFKATGEGRYTGQITDPEDDKTYSGHGALSGDSLDMSGCVLLVLCRTERWSRM